LEHGFNVTYTKSTLVTDTGYPCVDRNSYDLVSEWTNNIQLSDKSKLVVGGLFNQNRGHEDFTGTSLIAPYVASDGYVNAYAGYAQIDYWLLQSLKLIGGLQANKVGKLHPDVVRAPEQYGIRLKNQLESLVRRGIPCAKY